MEDETTGGNKPLYKLYPSNSEAFHSEKEDASQIIEDKYSEYPGGYTMDEPSDEYLRGLEQSANECNLILKYFDNTYLGCDLQDHGAERSFIGNGGESSFSCNCPFIGENYYKYLRYNQSVASFWDTPGS